MRRLLLVTGMLALCLIFLLVPVSEASASYDIAGWICGNGFTIYSEPDLNSEQNGTGGGILFYVPFTESIDDFYHIEINGTLGLTGWCYLPECSSISGEVTILTPNDMQQLIGADNPILYTYGDQADEIKTVQQLLAIINEYDEDYSPNITGIMDEITISDICSFQTYQELPSTGMLDARTYRILQSFVKFKTQGYDTSEELNRHGRKIVTDIFGWHDFESFNWYDIDSYEYFFIRHKYTINGDSWYGIRSSYNQDEVEIIIPDYTLELIPDEEYAQTQDGINLNVPNLTMEFNPAEKADWFLDEVPTSFYGAKIYDCYTGIVWEANACTANGHIDAEPASVEDTARLCRIYEVSSAKEIKDNALYAPRPCLLNAWGKTYACSLCGVPEEYFPDRSDNKFNGQLCIYFTGSVDHSGQTVSGHTQAIQYAWEHAPNSNIPFSPYMIRGTIGNVYWGINGNGQLTINGRRQSPESGYPAIDDYQEGSSAPWIQYKDDVYSILIRSNISRIGERAFKGITGFNSISIPYSVGSIGKEAFSDCTGLNEIEIKGYSITIDDYAFNNCSNLTRFEQTTYSSDQRHITYLGVGAFMNCSSLTSMNLPSDITTISEKLFMNCSSLINITYEGQITSIGDYAFAGCFTNQDTFQIPSSVTNIGAYAFSNCNSFTHMIIPANVNHLSDHIFSGCSMLQRLTILSRDIDIDPLFLNDAPETLVIYGYTGTSAETFAISNSYTFIDIENAATTEDFIIENNKLVSYRGPGGIVQVPEGVEIIGSYVFRNSTNRDAIVKVILPSTCTEIQDYAFGFSANLKEIALPEGLIAIGNHAFTDCSSLSDIILPSSLQTLDYAAFYNCISLVTINIPASLQNFSQYVFEKCSSLKNVTIEYGPTYIPGGAFLRCSSLEEIIIPGSVLSIENYAFGYCSNLKQFIAREGLQSIGTYAFTNCSNLEAIVLPSTCKKIPERVFFYQSKRTFFFAYPDTDLQNLPSNFDIVYREFPDFILPDSIQYIEAGAFQDIAARWIYIPDGCLSIGYRAFYNTPNLHMIRIPDNCHIEDELVYQWNQHIVILGYPGSEAEEYVKNHYNLSFLSIDEYNRLNAYH